MPWAKLDDQFHGNPKIRKVWRACPEALGLHVMAITYSAAHLLDGHVEPEFVEDQIPSKPRRERAVQVLVNEVLWIVREVGWEINGYLEFNPSRATVEAKRRARQEAGRAGGLASGASRKGEANE